MLTSAYNPKNQEDNELFDTVCAFYRGVKQNSFFALLDTNFDIIVIDKLSPNIQQVDEEGIIGKNFITGFKREKNRQLFVTKNLADCLNNKKSIRFLSVLKTRKPGYEMLLYSYSPVINPFTDNVIAVLVQAEVPVVPINMYRFKERLKRNDDYISPNREYFGELKLTKREKEILFLLFHCESRSEIAEILSNATGKEITDAAVIKVINRGLYTKFNVVNTDELKIIIRKKGYHMKVPDSLSNEFIFRVEEL